LLHSDLFEKIISLENLLAAWREFKRGKTSKLDVLEFYSTLEESFFELHETLREQTYQPAPYQDFFIADPKLRHIHKAIIRDRVVHQALFRILYPDFDKTFIHDSYSSRVGKGTHAGVRQLARYANKITANHTRPAYALKCDIKKFFDSIDHIILFRLLQKRIRDPEALRLVRTLIESFEVAPGKGLPLGNVTSQLFANVYMNELDQWIKHKLKVRYYLRYCDDFIILHEKKDFLKAAISKVQNFLQEGLHLSLHPHKFSIRKVRQGIDFLGYVVLPHAIMVRASTKRRVFRRVNKKNLPSYLGVLSHANARKLRRTMINSAK